MHLNVSQFSVISPQFPCGAAWLANALLELGVFLPNLWGFDTEREWGPGSQTRRYLAEDRPWRQTLASLQPGREFCFRVELNARFSHAFPWQDEMPAPRVLMLRDPRDALYSEWRRQQRNQGLPATVDLPQFLHYPFEHGPISQCDMLWLHWRCWLDEMQRDPQSIYLLRFEDCKRDPLGSLRALCNWLGLSIDMEALQTAVRASEVGRLQQIEAQLLQQDPHARQFNRRGQAYEWMQVWPLHWHAAIARDWQPLLEQLDYPPSPQHGERGPAFDVREVLRWRGLEAGTVQDRWAERIETWIAAGLSQQAVAESLAGMSA